MHTVYNINGIRWKIKEEYKDLLLDQLGSNFTDLLSNGQAFETASPTSVILIRLRGQKIFVKLLGPLKTPGLKEYILKIIKEARIKREWQIMNRVFHWGIPTAPPIAFGVNNQRSYLLTKAIEDCYPLFEFLSSSPQTLRKTGVVKLANLIRQMHTRGILHNDLCPSNILVRVTNDGLVSLYVIDFYNAKIKHTLSKEERLKNLAKIDRHFCNIVSRTERLRFFKEYTERPSGLQEEDKRDIRKIFKQIQKLNLRRQKGGWRKKLADFFEETF